MYSYMTGKEKSGKKSVVAIYSPLCEQNGTFLSQLEEWLQGKDIILHEIPFDKITDREKEWYISCGFLKNGHFTRSVFIDVFFEGNLIDSVPLQKENIEKELDIVIQKDEIFVKSGEEVSVPQFRNLLCRGDVEWAPITEKNYTKEMRLCTENYPYGSPPIHYHQRCIAVKERVYTEVFTKECVAGVFVTWQEKVVGLLEVFPREIIKKYGFLTGNQGKNEDFLTVGCLEVGYGIPRTGMIDELFFQLERVYPHFNRHVLEGVGTLEWNTGFTPYWVYDKYGFHRSETIDEKVIMEKKIQ